MGASAKKSRRRRGGGSPVRRTLSLLTGCCSVVLCGTTLALVAFPPTSVLTMDVRAAAAAARPSDVRAAESTLAAARSAAALRGAAAAAALSGGGGLGAPMIRAAAAAAAATRPLGGGASAADACRGVKRLERTDVVGGDIRQGGIVKGVRFEDCCTACRGHPGCTGFVHKSSSGWCYLKSHPAGAGEEAVRVSLGLTAGLVVVGGAAAGSADSGATAAVPPGPPPGVLAAAARGGSGAGGGGAGGGGERAPRDAEWDTKRDAVVDAFRWAWKGYTESAWGRDTLKPISKTGEDWFGLGLTLIDGLDTMWLMGMKKEFAAAREWVATNLHPATTQQPVNLFETTIRVLGGLLSSHALSGDPIFLTKAIELGERLLPAFKTPSGIPYSDVNLARGTASSPSGRSSLAEVTTIQMEFKYLAYLTNRSVFYTVANSVSEKVAALPKQDGLAPMFLDYRSGQFLSSRITLGARGDSYYEYLVKQYVVTGKEEHVFKKRWEEAVRGFEKRLIRTTQTSKLTYVAELSRPLVVGASESALKHAVESTTLDKMDHLVCFLPGSLALGAMHGIGGGMNGPHMKLAKALTRTCAEMYRTPAGLAPEIIYLKGRVPSHELPATVPSVGRETDGAAIAVDIDVHPRDGHNLLRPETVESLFYLWRATGDRQYRDAGWRMFKAFEKHTRMGTGGYTSLDTVMRVPAPRRDEMPRWVAPLPHTHTHTHTHTLLSFLLPLCFLSFPFLSFL